MKLNDRQIRNAKPKEKAYKLADGGGLYLQITPSGGKLWRLKYRIHGKEKTLSIGKYPAISLLEARKATDEAKTQLAQGIDPAAAKQQAKAERAAAIANTFENLARQWHQENIHRWKVNHAARILNHLEKDVFPLIGNRPMDDIAVSEIKAVLQKITNRGAFETAEKIRQWIGAVYKYTAILEITDRNPATVLQGFLIKPETQHMPALPPKELTEFYRRLLQADTHLQNKIGLMLLMLVFVRNGELRSGEWQHINWQDKVWNIPAENMKRPRPHFIPLSDWSMELLERLHSITGNGRFMFPNRNNSSRYISENTFSVIMAKMGYKGIATPHGFRSLASSMLNEQGFNTDAIERQLAHEEINRTKAAYNRAEYVEERREMMQWWSDYLRQHYNEAKAQL